MKVVQPQPDWPESWLASYKYDREEIYDEIHCAGYAYAYKNRVKHTLDMVSKIAPPGSTILDLAGAQGNFSLTLAELGYDVVWNDLREELAGYVALKYERGKIRYLPGNIFDLKNEEAYDLVLITEVIEHVAHPDQFLQQVSRLVKPGGWIVMTTPNGEYFRNTLPKFSDCADPSVFESVQFKPNSDGHIFLLHQDEIYRIAAQCALTVLELSYFTTPLTSGHVKTESLLRIMPEASVEWLERQSKELPQQWQRKLCVQIGAIFQKPIEAKNI